MVFHGGYYQNFLRDVQRGRCGGQCGQCGQCGGQCGQCYSYALLDVTIVV